MEKRLARHREIESEVLALTDDGILRWLSPAKPHATLLAPRGGARVFVKLLPLTALEREHPCSTANLFGLPTFYQYRLGGCGFGAWRELDIHLRTTAWVLSGECAGFPLLHGWRVLPVAPAEADDKRTLAPWGGDPAIGRRVAAVEAATHSIALFLEHFPGTLGPEPGLETVLRTLRFLHDRGVLHMDAHFGNVLTDGSRVVLGDFGLATSRSFDLDAGEIAFFDRHGNFDACTAVTSHVHAVVTRIDPAAEWRRTLRALMDGSHARAGEVPADARACLAHRGPLALAMGDFYRRLTADLSTAYPAEELQRLLDGGASG